MNEPLILILGLLLAGNPTSLLSNWVQQKTGLSVDLTKSADPVEAELSRIMAEDDAAQAEADQWVKEDHSFAAKGAGAGSASLRGRILQRFEPVKKSYEDFLKRHPQHARGHLAYGSFLSDIGDETNAQLEWEKARELDPKNPAAWNNLANWYGHNSPVTKAFDYYAKAIELNPRESIYYHNLATTVFMFRRDATNHFKITEPQVFEKAMGLYRKALELDPGNFVLATDYAQSYYGYKPPSTGNPQVDRGIDQKFYQDAITAWQQAYKLAGDDIERQGVLIHFARVQINAGDYREARQNLNAVTNAMFDNTKKLLMKKLEKRENPNPTNAPPNQAVTAPAQPR